MIFKREKQHNRGVAVGLDLGSHQIKIAVVSRTGESLRLEEYLMAPSPATLGKAGAEQQFGAELQQLFGKLKLTERRTFVAISCDSATVCEAELPRIPLEEVNHVLHLNSQRYLRRDLTNYYLDACELGEPLPEAKTTKKTVSMKLLIAAAARERVLWYRDALVAAKLRPEAIELTAVTVVNALQVSHPEVCAKEAVLLVDIGAQQTSINILRQGQPLLTRLMRFGGAQVTESIGQALAIPLAEAEAAKLAMGPAVQPLVQAKLHPLAREVRSSIDFFERQQECHVSKALAGGGTACSPLVLKFLSEAVGVSLERWNPLEHYQIDTLNGDSEKLAALAPSLAAAVGVAVPRVNGPGGKRP